MIEGLFLEGVSFGRALLEAANQEKKSGLTNGGHLNLEKSQQTMTNYLITCDYVCASMFPPIQASNLHATNQLNKQQIDMSHNPQITIYSGP